MKVKTNVDTTELYEPGMYLDDRPTPFMWIINAHKKEGPHAYAVCIGISEVYRYSASLYSRQDFYKVNAKHTLTRIL